MRIPVRRFDRTLVLDERCFCGRVEMTFQRAAVVRPDDGSERVTLLEQGRPLTPLAVACGSEGFRWTQGAGVRMQGPPPGVECGSDGFRWMQGADVELCGRRLTVAAGSGLRLEVLLAGDGVSLGLGRSRKRFDVDVLGLQLSALASALPARVRTLGDGAVQRRVMTALAGETARLCGLLAGDVAAAEAFDHPVRALAGLGPGLTPAGDDVLTGLAAAALRFGQAGRLRWENVNRFLDRVAAVDPGSTTVVGAEMLGHAARGVFSEVLLDFVETLGTPGVDRLAVRADRLSQYGGSSGCDMLSGAVALAREVAERASVGATARGLEHAMRPLSVGATG